MRWIRFHDDGAVRTAILEGSTVRPVRGDMFSDYEIEDRCLDLADVRLDVPVFPRTFYAAGFNYQAHAASAGLASPDRPAPKEANIGYRATNALIAHEEPIIVPPDATDKVNYEGEIVVVIGRKAKNLDRDNALSAVFGYTIGNDVSERTWQKTDSTFWRAKNTDTFKPMGPWIETDVVLDDLETVVRLNGEEQIRFATNDMIFGIVDYLVRMTRYLTLYPGDVVWMGTEGTSPNLLDGDVVEIEISGIGTLRNPVVRQAG
ncbi:fumarylacetoacetate hydrolase family protein [Microbaculum marinum]|uniref:Fumarylacetoacetate hydrolase family protein n=1 Tax=Microbaculum marinum TaxID=1764581 RepID=A0AAW9RSS0_9HYPH